MDIQKLQALAVIQEAGSFSRAAETLGYSQAGLTYMMNSLENEVGLRLLDRSYSGVRLSETGKALMPKIHRLLQVYDSLNGEIRACKRSQESTLRLAALDTISTRWVPRAVAQLKEEYPHITVSVISGSPMQVDNWLRDGSVEIGVTDRRWTGAELDWTKLVDDPFLAVLCRIIRDSFCLLNKPVILVPSPNVAEDHQTKNALALVDKKAAIYVKDVDAMKHLIPVALETVTDAEKLKTLSENIAKLALPDSATIIAKEVLKLINNDK